MKKILYSVFAFAIAAFTLTSCEDVPAPYEMPDEGDIDKPVVFEPTGSGTADDPYNVAAIIDVAETLGQGEVSTDSYYFEGYVTSIKENYDYVNEKGQSFGNATLYISDDEKGSNSFYVYRAKYFNGQSYSSGILPQEGDKVVFYGKLTNYNGTLETNQNDCYLVSINGQTDEGEGGGDEPVVGQPEGDGTLENPFNAVAAYQYVMNLEDNITTEESFYIKGVVSRIRSNYGEGDYPQNANYYISVDGTYDSDDSGNQFYIYASNYLNNEPYSSGDVLSVGDEVVIYGKLVKFVSSYGTTPETSKTESYLYEWNKGQGGDQPGGGEITGNSISVDVSTLGLENGAALETITLADGTTLTFDGGGNQNTPKYYNNGTNIRMYPKNSITINSSRTIVGIEFTCTETSEGVYNASGDISTTSGTVSTNGTLLTVTGASSNKITLTDVSSTNGLPSQFRFTNMTIYYAE